jgi:hypothetical protein
LGDTPLGAAQCAAGVLLGQANIQSSRRPNRGSAPLPLRQHKSHVQQRHRSAGILSAGAAYPTWRHKEKQPCTRIALRRAPRGMITRFLAEERRRRWTGWSLVFAWTVSLTGAFYGSPRVSRDVLQQPEALPCASLDAYDLRLAHAATRRWLRALEGVPTRWTVDALGARLTILRLQSATWILPLPRSTELTSACSA